mmetsp:Transcript_5606/g.21222  ORF Transcript_5606/g.21222 Transcript_5606/m.21222 type:complete len:303 (+) Transcript_5606:39-947(+)
MCVVLCITRTAIAYSSPPVPLTHAPMISLTISLIFAFLSVKGTPNFSSKSPLTFFMEMLSMSAPFRSCFTASSKSASLGILLSGASGSSFSAGSSSEASLASLGFFAAGASPDSLALRACLGFAGDGSGLAAAAFFSSFASSSACLCAMAWSSFLIPAVSSGSFFDDDVDAPFLVPPFPLAFFAFAFSFFSASFSFFEVSRSRFSFPFSLFSSAAALTSFFPDATGLCMKAMSLATLASFFPSSPTPRGRSNKSRTMFSVAANALVNRSSLFLTSNPAGKPENARMFFLITVALPGVRYMER